MNHLNLFNTGLVILLATCSCVGSVEGQSISGYTYSKSGASGISALAAKLPNDIDNVYLKAVDVTAAGQALAKLNASDRFFPNSWTGSTSPPPTFTAMVSVALGVDWSNYQTTKSELQNALTTYKWLDDYNAGMTIDSEFAVNLKTFDANWVAFMVGMREFANNAGQDFSFYLNPKYLNSARFPDAAMNAADVAKILGSSTTHVNEVLFPVYIGGGANTDSGTLDAAALAMKTEGLAYEWIHDITEDTGTFKAGMAMAHNANVSAGFIPNGVSVYQYLNDEPVTQNMNDNLAALVGNPNSVVPEPTAILIWAIMAGFGATIRRRR